MMKIAERIHLVGSGRFGFDLTDELDCHVYLIDGGDEYALIDAGAGRDVDAIITQIGADGLDPKAVRHLILTHAHADHSGGAAGLRERLDLTVVASNEAAMTVRTGDEQRLSLGVARQAGAYPPDYRYDACPVDVEIGDGENYRVGDLVLTALATPGHSGDQLSFVLRQASKVSVFCGDTVFAGGRVLLQDIWDCSVQASCRSVERLDGLGIDGLYPGHLSFAVQRGHRHVARAMVQVRQLLPPEQLA